MLGVSSPHGAHEAFDEIVRRVRAHVPAARIDGVLVQRMVAPGRELIAGASREPDCGALVMFGLGGIYVEALHDVVFRIAPLDVRQADEMLDGIRGAPILRGVRGEAPVDRAAVADALRRVGQLAYDFPEIRELDLNPLVASRSGVIVADARVLLSAR